MTQYKMVVLDMDDTLMNSDNKLSIETKSYLLDSYIYLTLILSQ
jgi:hydroxymethylpyrimidine pyrophosphatase-like HAD family hydrolase